MRSRDPQDVAAELDGYARQRLILSWRMIRGRFRVIAADMDEYDMTAGQAWLFAGGVASAAQAIHDGMAPGPDGATPGTCGRAGTDG